MSRLLPLSLLAPALCLTAGLASAQITHFEALNINGANEVPANGSPSIGRADYVLNEFNNTLHYNVSYSALTSAETMAHVHRVNTTIMRGFPSLGSPKVGVFTFMTAGEEADMLTGTTYTNIHTTMFGGGEIRDTNVLAPPIGTSSCFGTNAVCPCANGGAAGRGCDNSVPGVGGALISATGHNSPDNVVLIADGMKPNGLTVFVQGLSTIAPVAYGDGVRCWANAGFKRLVSRNADGAGWNSFPRGGEPTITARSAALGDVIPPGGTRNYSVFYRDGQAGFCTVESFNGSQLITITW